MLEKKKIKNIEIQSGQKVVLDSPLRLSQFFSQALKCNFFSLHTGGMQGNRANKLNSQLIIYHFEVSPS